MVGLILISAFVVLPQIILKKRPKQKCMDMNISIYAVTIMLFEIFSFLGSGLDTH